MNKSLSKCSNNNEIIYGQFVVQMIYDNKLVIFDTTETYISTNYYMETMINSLYDEYTLSILEKYLCN